MDFDKLILRHGNKANYIDSRIENAMNETIVMKNNEISSISSSFASGFCFRVFLKNGIGFSCSSDFSKKEKVLKEAFKLAIVSSKFKRDKIKIERYETNRDSYKINYEIDPFNVSFKKKIDFLHNINKKLQHNKIKSIVIKLTFSKVNKRFLNNKGAEINTNLIYSILKINVIGREMDKTSECFFSIGKTNGYELIEGLDIDEIVNELKQRNLRLLHARHIKKGRYNVICDPILSGVFFHEAIGHACEADHIITKQSILHDKIGRKIGSDLITLYDDPLIKDEIGSYKYDDEGIKARRTKLIENGKLCCFLNSLSTSNKLNMDLTSNGRAQSPFYLPIPRMSNTTLAPGDFSEEELIEEMKNGIYAKGSRGGVVEPTLGNFVFNAEEAFLVKNRRIVENLRDFSLSGNILETLRNVVRVGRDNKPQYLGAVCGKIGQNVPVGSATPHILVRDVIVGGR
jgi:TldD protein